MAVVGREEFAVPPPWVVMALGALVFVTVVVSGIDYVLIYGDRALNAARTRRRGARRPTGSHEATRRSASGCAADAVFDSFWPGQNAEILAALRAPSTAPALAVGRAGHRQDPSAAGGVCRSG